ncbi:hypothetical protein K0B96_16385 [Horticoccus luteus]|uniref:Exo-alpha-sialidase n=1 Tax=Horticoccus luteus TaxID=2862869 RepID=A0A8F9TVG4_9BACT|nr:sialidase family protein [Horticoccus luteus]QYM78860.1 hypothetical protein K0B96_16385 [Horticoccus luteus]
MRTLLVSLLACGLVAVSRGAEAPMHHHGAMNPAQTELGADAAFDAHGALWVVAKISGHIAVRQSADFGRSWSNPVLVTPLPETTDAGGDARPKIALGPKSEIYVTWTKPLAKPYTGEVKFSRSLDGGRTFTPPVIVHHDRQEITHRFDALTVNARGQVFVAWIDKRDGVRAAAEGKSYRGAAIYFAVSDDQGATFRGDFKVADHSCECCRIALVAEPDGNVRAMWRHVFAPDIRDHAVATLHADGTVSEMARATFDNWHIDACPHHGPGLAEDGAGDWHAVWFSGAPQSLGVFYGRLRAGAVEGQQRVGGETAEHAAVAASGKRVAVAWKAFDGQHTRLRSMSSNDGGRTWTESELGSTSGASGHPAVLTFAGHFYVLWNTQNESLTLVALP